MHNYMVVDAGETIAAAAAFVIVFLPPGFLLGLISNVLGFRRRSPAERLLLSIALSTAVAPILVVLVSRVAGLTICVAILCLMAVVAAALFSKEISGNDHSFRPIPRSTWGALAIAMLWAVVAIGSVIDLQIGDRLYPTAAIFDYSLRIPLVEAVARTGVPPLNPFFDLGNPPTLRYFYYWYVVCAMPERLAGLPARACFHGSVIWSGFALAAILPLFLKHFFEERDKLRGKSLVAISLLLVTGLDLIPWSVLLLRLHLVFPDLEWWDRNQVTSWLNSLVWVPHHVAALTACMTGLLVLATLEDNAGMRERRWAALISGLAFASTAGLSAFVAFAFAVFAILWMVIQFAQRRVADAVTFSTAGVLALLLSLPYIADLRTQSRITHRFAVLALPHFSVAITRLPVSILLYVIEFGFFLLIGVLRFKSELLKPGRLGQKQRAAWVLLASTLLIVATLQSDPALTGSNDLAYRGILPAQFILLLWAVPVVYGLVANSNSSPIRPIWKALLIFSLVIGALGTVVQLTMLRCYAPLADLGRIQRTEMDSYFGPSPAIGRRIYALRNGLENINRATNQTSVLQFNPESTNAWVIHIYSTRQEAAGDADCGSTFGGDPEECQKAVPSLTDVFNAPEEAREMDLDALCNRFSIDMLVATDADPAWGDASSWVWSKKPVIANDYIRGFDCGASAKAH